jgi:predicted GH43/DUF377 family glycosyl hydrolase
MTGLRGLVPEDERFMPMGWRREGSVFARSTGGEPDSLRAFRPWVLEEGDETLRMWYAGHDGTTWRILEALRRPGDEWERLGVAIDTGFAGESDDYGVESPCVVKTPGGYLMAYEGFDGEVTRLHMATSRDGREWDAHGTIMQRGIEDVLGAGDPCLMVTAERWWLFFSGYDGSRDARRASVVAAVSPTGASWDRIGIVLEPETDELAASHPCVLDFSRIFYMFYASDDGRQVRVDLATSRDGTSWERRGTTLGPSGQNPDGLGAHSPCVVRLSDGSLRMWYAGLQLGDTEHAYRICSARFAGSRWPDVGGGEGPDGLIKEPA